jgi:ATP-binding cassette subfamily F protein 3
MLKHYAELQERFESGGGYEMDARMNQVTNGLRISSEQFNRRFSSLSGGEKTKVGLAALLIERSNLLLLDEPTNHLDLTGVEWLEAYLNAYEGTCIIVSHDRYFLDRVVTKIVEIEDGEAFVYHTNYSGYLQEKDERLLLQFASYQEQQKKIKHMKETIKRLEEWGRIGDNGKFFRRAASMQKALDRMEKVKRPDLEPKTVDFELKQADRSGQKVLTMERVSKSYGGRLILNGIEQSLQYGNKVALIGNNGSGKSTLFKLLLGQEMCDEGSVTLGSRIEIGYLSQEEKPPQDRKKTVLQVYREEAGLEEGEARGILAGYLFYGGDVFKAVHLLSGGEWTRLRLAILMHKQPNFLLLDEPTNHLDISSREALEAALEDFPGTVLVVSHDRYFINRIAQQVWELHDGKLTGYLGNFDAYKEKHKQLLQMHESDDPVVQKKPKYAIELPRPKQDQTNERNRAHLEQSIAEAEERLAKFDVFFQLPNCTDDAVKYNQSAAEWEDLKNRLEVLYEQWMEHER